MTSRVIAPLGCSSSTNAQSASSGTASRATSWSVAVGFSDAASSSPARARYSARRRAPSARPPAPGPRAALLRALARLALGREQPRALERLRALVRERDHERAVLLVDALGPAEAQVERADRPAVEDERKRGDDGLALELEARGVGRAALGVALPVDPHRKPGAQR